METNDLQSRGFATISTADGRLRIWVQRPTKAGRIYASCNFPLAGHWDFVDSWKSHATLTPLAKQDCPPLATI